MIELSRHHFKHSLIATYLGLMTLACAAVAMPALAAERPVVAAAASLNKVLTSIMQAFANDTGEQIRVSFGSSGNLTRQIMQGAPYDLFLSADKSYVETLYAEGLVKSSGDLYAIGRLVLFVPNNSILRTGATLEDLATALKDGRLKRLAIANPEHAPYGRAAREVLQHQQLWQSIQGKLLFGENVAQAAQFTVSGADAGIISYSIALEFAATNQGVFVLLPESWYQPLHHHMVLLPQAGEVAQLFYTYLRAPGAQEIFEKFGFLVPTTPQ